MIRIILVFLFFSILASLIIIGVQKLTGKQALALTKVAGLAIISSSVALALMFILVELF